MRNNPDPLAIKIEPHSISDLLRRFSELHRHYLAGRDIELLEVTLGLDSQQQCTGYILNYSNEIVLLAEKQERTDPFRINYINIRNITNLQLEWKENLVDVLDPAKSLPVLEFPSRLELTKRIKTLESELCAELAHPFSIQVDYNAIQDTAQFAFILNYVSDIVAVVQDIVKEKLVLESFRESIEIITVHTGSGPGFELNGTRALFTIDIHRGGSGRFSKALIRNKIEAVL